MVKYGTPGLAAAGGAVFFFYVLSPAPGTAALLPAGFVLAFLPLVIAGAFLRVLVLGPFLFRSPAASFPARRLRILAAALAAGAGVGWGAGWSAAAAGVLSLGLPPGAVRGVTGVLREDPRSYNDGRGRGAVDLTEAVGAGGVRAAARGVLTVYFPGAALGPLKDFGRGCRVYVEGTMAGGSLRATAVYVTAPASPVETFRTTLRARLLGRLNGGGLSPGSAALASALLLGVRDDLDSLLADNFSKAGCAHVLALSGMHLTLVSAGAAFLLRRLLGVRAAALGGALFVALYVALAGGQPALVRAGLMYFLGTACVLGFLKKEPLNLLCLAFVLQLVLRPETGRSASFILSYLALGGILTLGPLFRELLAGRLPPFLAGGLAASLGAFVASAPAVALFFDTLRPVGILAGLVIAPLASVFMAAALAFLALGLPPPGALDLLYRALDTTASLAARAPGLPGAAPVLIAAAALLALGRWDHARRSRLAPPED